MNFQLFPDQASTSAEQVDAVYLAFIGVSVVFVLLVFAPMAWCLVRYRRGSTANRRGLSAGDLKLELTWALIPFLLMTGMFAWSAEVFFNLRRSPDGAAQINVVGKQWMWKAHHANGVREINELHVPVGRDIQLLMTSEDVIHSFYIPAFRIKQDVVPGYYSTLWFQPTRAGIYHLFCAEYCGKDHSRMRGRIVALPPAEYQRWLERAGARDSLAEQGRTLYRELGCSGCHEESQRVRAPSLKGLYGRPVPLEDGTVVQADDQYLHDSIVLPQSKITAGYEPVMPSYEGLITEEQVMQLTAYIKQLGNDRRGESP